MEWERMKRKEGKLRGEATVRQTVRQTMWRNNIAFK
jgi:hypothetical protein